MNIVGSTYFLRNLRDLDFFTLDFGKSKKDNKTEKFRKVDDFIIRYKQLYNKQILKFGRIGNKINFYEDLSMDNNEYIIFNNDDIYEITFDNNEIKNMEQYILSTLRKIEENDNKEQELVQKNNEKINDLLSDEGWVAQDDKNFNKTYLIDQTLSREKYREEMLRRFRKKQNS